MPLLSDASGSRRRMRMDREPSAPRAERVCDRFGWGGRGAGGRTGHCGNYESQGQNPRRKNRG